MYIRQSRVSGDSSPAYISVVYVTTRRPPPLNLIRHRGSTTRRVASYFNYSPFILFSWFPLPPNFNLLTYPTFLDHILSPSGFASRFYSSISLSLTATFFAPSLFNSPIPPTRGLIGSPRFPKRGGSTPYATRSSLKHWEKESCLEHSSLPGCLRVIDIICAAQDLNVCGFDLKHPVAFP